MNFPGVYFLGTALKFRKRKKNSSSLVTSSIKREIWHLPRRIRGAVTVKKCT